MMTPRKPLSRRTFLRGSLAGVGLSMALPPLEAMLTPSGAYAGAAPNERFFILYFWGGGLPWNAKHGAALAGHPDLWTPTTTGAGYAATELLAPLAAHAPTVISGLEPRTAIPSTPGGQDDPHMRGFMVSMTGDRPGSEGYDQQAFIVPALRPTLDQVVARHPDFYAAPPQFRSVEVGVSAARMKTFGHWNNVSYNGPGSTNEAIMRATALFDRLFGVPQDTTLQVDRSRALDAVLDDAHALQARLGAADRQRVEAHLQHVSEIQRRLDTQVVCEAPARPGDGGDLVTKARTMADLLALAVSCGQTRVATMQFTTPGSPHVYADLDPTVDFHTGLHNGKWDLCRAGITLAMRGLGALLDAFAAIDLPAGGNLLDQGLVYGTSEYGEGYDHTNKEHPIVMIGGAGGALARGVHVRDAGATLSRAQLTALKALGLPFDSFGWNGGETSAPFAELLP